MFASAPLGAVMAAALSAFSSGGGFLDLGGGWVAEWGEDVDPEIILRVNGITSEGVFIEKDAFYKPGWFENGPPIEITFRQVSEDAVPYIVIQEEEIHNSSGLDWAAFEMTIGGDPGVHFDPARTAASGGPSPIGFDVSPFNDAAFFNSDRTLRAFDGVIPNGNVWQAGIGAGSLWIYGAPTAGAPFTEFTLTETPLLATPAPGAFALLLMSGLIGCSRRRRE